MNRGPCMPWIVLSAKCWLSTGARSSGSFKRPHDGHRPRSAILSAAAQVLAKEGAQRFTTARVAERAGVSVGSVYQYFPNKASILFRLQSDEWRQTSDLLHDILQDGAKPPLERLRTLVLAFLRSECEEAAMRVALSDAAPLYRDAPAAQEIKSSGDRVLHMFMREVLPGGQRANRRPGNGPGHGHAWCSRKAVFGKSANDAGNRNLWRGRGGHALRLSRKPPASLKGMYRLLGRPPC